MIPVTYDCIRQSGKTGTDIVNLILNAKMDQGIFMEISDFLEAVDERNRASEMAMRYATLILKDFRNLTPASRSLMADMLIDLISGQDEDRTPDS